MGVCFARREFDGTHELQPYLPGIPLCITRIYRDPLCVRHAMTFHDVQDRLRERAIKLPGSTELHKLIYLPDLRKEVTAMKPKKWSALKKSKITVKNMQWYRAGVTIPASLALARLRQHVIRGEVLREHYSSVNGEPFDHCGIEARWIERPADCGLREVCWEPGSFYVREDCGEKITPAVFQLPARGGKLRYLYGHKESEGLAALLCCRIIECESVRYASQYESNEALEQAKRAAQRFTEDVAEEQWNRNEEYNAGAMAAFIHTDTMKPLRAQARELIAAIRDTKLEKTRASLVSSLKKICEDLEDCRAEIKQMRDCHYHSEIFNDGFKGAWR